MSMLCCAAGGFNPRAPTASWLHDIYPSLENETAALQARPADVLEAMREKGALVDGKLMHECSVKQNEAIYIPSEWYHATMSLSDSVTVTTSWELQWLGKGKTSRRGVAGAAYALTLMTQAAELNKWKKVAKFARRYIRERPHSFLGYSWLGMSLYFQFQDQLDDNGMPRDFQKAIGALFQAEKALNKCINFNSLFSPCWLWQHRVMVIIEHAARANNDLEKAKESAETLSICERRIAELSTMDDDEMYGMDQG
jgi:hypothetical protein